ncbi:MAG: tripartite tricarboxylate transporter substrate binding protein [Burkholderiaceae bacterium]|nr:tripartite tricarboxylate transporter substrate binding protein [Burkholderiaceae bacterium]
MQRRSILRAIGAGAALASLPSLAQVSSKPVTLIVPFAAGGNIDLVGRTIAVPMARLLGQPVVVQNRPGAGGAIGVSEVARAEPDGTTLLVSTPNAIVVLPRMVHTNYDLASFASVGLISFTSLVVVVRSENPKFKTLPDLIAYARANPGRVAIANSGIGTTNHMAILQLQEAAGIKFNVVAYKGSGPAIIDLLGGQVDVMVDQLSSSINNIKAGKFIALSVLSTARDPLVPDVPGTKEGGLAAVDTRTMTGLLAPAKTPSATLGTLNAALNKALEEEEIKTQLLRLGSIARPGPAEAFTVLLKAEDRQAKALADAGKLKSE